ncbi:MOSC domain-containing protein [Pseudanabaena biceps]|nr:MOSC domain-containing protein [Pseudanabaena biceps]
MAKLDKILIFPLKSLDAIALNEVKISAGGALQGDREFALFDQQGRYLNAKRSSKIHSLRSNYPNYELGDRLICLDDGSTSVTFHLDQDRANLANWLSQFFEQSLTIQQNIDNGFPDDPEAWGATIISLASLELVQSWYTATGKLDIEQIRRRFRTNLEVADTEAFWEDRLFTKNGETVPFQIGKVEFLGTNPCQRCPVPTRDPYTGQVYPEFQKIFVKQREQTLPTNIERSRFNHFYRLALNTRIPLTEAGKTLKVGDFVRLGAVSDST